MAEEHYRIDVTHSFDGGADATPDLRDRFAAAALTGYLAAFTGDQPLPNGQAMAFNCYDYADAMLAERLRRKGAEGA
jgi:CO dehydrogenase/acetyl-CoA synthase delta subunit